MPRFWGKVDDKTFIYLQIMGTLQDPFGQPTNNDSVSNMSAGSHHSDGQDNATPQVDLQVTGGPHTSRHDTTTTETGLSS